VSGTVRELVRQQLGVSFVDAGEQRVKNISQPIRVFKVELQGTTPPQERRRGRRWPRWAAAAATLIAFAAALWLVTPQRSQPAAPQMLVVLPFDHPARAGTEALAESLTRQVTSAVSQLSGVTVIAPAVAAKYGVHRGEMRRIGDELNVRYALDGRVEQAGQQVRVAVHVVDTGSGGSLWSGELQAPTAPDGTAPLALIGQLSDSLRAAMRSAELKRVSADREEATAYAAALLATDELEKSTDGTQLAAIRAHFERALALDAQHVPALNGYAHTLLYLADLAARGPDADALLRKADEVSLKAVTLQPDSAEAWAARANALYFRHRLDAAAEAVQRGLRLNPYLVMLHSFAGQIHLAQDRGEQALAAFSRGLELNPTGPLYGVLMHYRSRALLMLGRFEEAIESCERGMAFGPEWPDYMLLTAAYALQGDEQRAARARAELMRLQPAFTLRWHKALADRGASGVERQFDRVLHAGLRKAGVAE
jgi:TolB-like protein